MLAFIIRRALQAIGVLFAVGLIAFAMFRFAGDPVNQIVSLDTPAAEREAVRRSLGLDDPVPVQFTRYLVRAVQGDFGISYQFRQPVSTLLAERMPATLELAFAATLLAVIFGILMGVYSALRRDSLLAKVFQTISLIGISLPTFLTGILLIYLFSVTLGWIPLGRDATLEQRILADLRARLDLGEVVHLPMVEEVPTPHVDALHGGEPIGPELLPQPIERLPDP